MNDSTKRFLVTRFILLLVLVMCISTFIGGFLVKNGQPQTVQVINAMILLVIPFAAFSAVRKFDLQVIYKTDNLIPTKLNIVFWVCFIAITLSGFLVKSSLTFVVTPVLAVIFYSHKDYKANAIFKKD